MRLIDANALKLADFQDFSNTDVFAVIDAAPTVDAVPVVRCRDCIYWGDADGVRESTNGVRFARCKVHNHAVDGASYGWCPEEDDFCSLGERKNNGETN